MFFFFCKQKTAYEMRISDWSSDVCSSDLEADGIVVAGTALDPPGVVLLGVQDAGAGAHPLGQARVDHALVALGVLVHEGALKHPGDDLHVTVRMGLERSEEHTSELQSLMRISYAVFCLKKKK